MMDWIVLGLGYLIRYGAPVAFGACMVVQAVGFVIDRVDEMRGGRGKGQ